MIPLRINLLILVLFYLFAANVYAQKTNYNPQGNKLNFIGLKLMIPFPTGDIDDVDVNLFEEEGLSLLNYNLKNGIGITYSRRIPVNRALLSSFEGEINLKSIEGNVLYRRRGTWLGTGGEIPTMFLENKVNLNFRNIFFGSAVKFRKNILKSGALDFIYGAELDGRIFNDVDASFETFISDRDGIINIFDESRISNTYKDRDLVFAQFNLNFGLGFHTFLKDSLISFDLIFSYSTLQIHNAGSMRVNPLYFSMKYAI